MKDTKRTDTFDYGDWNCEWLRLLDLARSAGDRAQEKRARDAPRGSPRDLERSRSSK